MQQPGQMLGMGAAIQGKARRGSDSGLTLPRPRWRDRCPSAEQHPLQGSWGWGARHPAVSAALPLPEEMPGLLERVGGWPATPSLVWVFAKGTAGNTSSLKAEGLQPLLKVAPSPTHPFCLEEPPWLRSAEPLPGIASAGRGHTGSTQRQVSSPSSPSPASGPGSRQQDQVAAEAALCRAARQPLPQEGWAAHLKVTAGTRRGPRGAGLGACKELCNTRRSGGSRQDKPAKPT